MELVFDFETNGGDATTWHVISIMDQYHELVVLQSSDHDSMVVWGLTHLIPILTGMAVDGPHLDAPACLSPTCELLQFGMSLKKQKKKRRSKLVMFSIVKIMRVKL